MNSKFFMIGAMAEIKSCNDFMKRGFAAQFGERLKFLSPQQATGYFGIFTTAHRAVVPHFRFKKDLILYLNSSRAASSGEFKFKCFTEIPVEPGPVKYD